MARLVKRKKTRIDLNPFKAELNEIIIALSLGPTYMLVDVLKEIIKAQIQAKIYEIISMKLSFENIMLGIHDVLNSIQKVAPFQPHECADLTKNIFLRIYIIHFDLSFISAEQNANITDYSAYHP